MTKHFSISDIKLDEWKNPGDKQVVYYDYEIDSMLLFVKPPKGRYAGFRVDDAVSLLFISETKELIGARFDSFYKSFIRNAQRHPRVWRLSDSNLYLEGSSDLEFIFSTENDTMNAEGNLIFEYAVEHSPVKRAISFKEIPVPA